mmetsp:Transcript_52619/g.139765  ORF Transcript_52619/g.139765 Transcript_52619/m.139765 type:complete len:1780 (-) Transcript_52619:248-5587(-)
MSTGKRKRKSDEPLLGANLREPMVAAEKAAWILEDALEGNYYNWYPDKKQARLDYLTLRRLQGIYDSDIVYLFLLAFFEVPIWCDTSNSFSFLKPEDRCKVPEGQIYLAGLPHIPPGFSIVFELSVMLVIWLKLDAEQKLQKNWFKKMDMDYVDRTFHSVGKTAVMVMLFDTVLFTIRRHKWRLAPFMRVVLMLCKPKLNQLLCALISIVNEWLSVASFWIGTVVFFAWIAVTIFENDTFRNKEDAMVNAGFDTFGNGLYTVFVASATVDFVDKFNPTFSANRAYGLLWFVCLFLSNFLFLNLILAMVFETYASKFSRTMQAVFANRARSVQEVFKILDQVSPDEPGITSETFFELTSAYGQSAMAPKFKRDDVAYIFTHLDHDGTGSLDEEKFQSVANALQYKFWIARQNNYLEDRNPQWYSKGCLRRLKQMVWEGTETGEPSRLDNYMNYVLLLNAVVVVAESAQDLEHITKYDSVFTAIEFAFSWAYVVEFVILILAMSWAEYTSSRARLFDFFTTWLLFGVSLAYYLPFADVQGELMRYANMLRLLRLIRVIKSLKRLPKVAFMFKCVSTLLVSATDILQFLLVIVYVYASLGIQLFGGVLYQHNEDLEGTEYNELNYFAFNFNDLLSGCALWFVNLLSEYNAAFADGVHAALPDSYKFTWLLFPMFYFSVVILAFELVSAFTIETFVALTSDEPQSEDEEELAEAEPVEEPLTGLSKLAYELRTEKQLIFHYTLSAAAEQARVYEIMFMQKAKDKKHGEHEEHEEHGEEEKHGEPEHEHKSEENLYEAPENATQADLEKLRLVKEAFEMRCEMKRLESEKRKLREEQEVVAADTGPEEPNESKMNKVQRAAWILEDAVQGKCFSWYPESLAARRTFLLLRKREFLYDRAIFVIFVLGFFEVPLWCDCSATFRFIPGKTRCSVSDGGIVYLSGLPQIPPGFCLMIELACMIVIWLKLRAEKKLQSKFFDKRNVTYVSRNFHVACYLAMFVSLWDIWIFATLRPSSRMSPYMRVVFMFCIPAVNALFRALIGILNEWLSVVSFWMGTVLFFAWIGVTLLDDNTSINPANVRVNKGFDTFGRALYTMFVASSSDDFINCFNPTFLQNRAYGLLWIWCLFLSNFLFLNLILAMIFETYKERFEKEIRSFQRNQAQSLKKVFSMVATTPEGEDEPTVSREDFFALISALAESPKTPSLDKNSIEYVYKAIDVDNNSTLEASEFESVIDSIQKTFWITQKYSVAERWFPSLYEKMCIKQMKHWVWDKDDTDQSKLDNIMNVVLLANTAVVVAESYYDINHISTYNNLFTGIETVFGMVYIVEFFILVLSMSWGEYISSASRIFDCFTTWLLFGVSLLYYLPVANVQAGLMHYANILRLLRLVRVLKSLKRVSKVAFMFKCVSTILSSATEILFLLLILLYFYSSLAVQLFGGLLYQNNEKLEGSEYAEKQYYAFNMNDMTMAMAMWFVTLLCEYNPAIVDGLRSSLQPWRHGSNPTWVIFPIFYFSVVIFAFELVCAFIIETFTELADEERKDAAEAEAEAHAEFELEGASDAGSGSGGEFEEEDPLEQIAAELDKQDMVFHYTVSAAATKAKIYKMMFEAGSDEEGGESDGSMDFEAKKKEVSSLKKLATHELHREIQELQERRQAAAAENDSERCRYLETQIGTMKRELEEKELALRAARRQLEDMDSSQRVAVDKQVNAESSAQNSVAIVEQKQRENDLLREELRKLQNKQRAMQATQNGAGTVANGVQPSSSVPAKLQFTSVNPLTFQIAGNITFR